MQFFKRSKDNIRPSSPSYKLIIDLQGRDYLSLSTNNTNIKFWIPERLEKKIDQLCTYFDTSASDFIRQVLFVHLYSTRNSSEELLWYVKYGAIAGGPLEKHIYVDNKAKQNESPLVS